MADTEKKKVSPTTQYSRVRIGWSDVPLRYQFPLSVVLIFFAVILIFPTSEGNEDAPIFQSAREEDGQNFAANRLKDAPILYGLAHSAMGALWCMCIPLQHIKSIRQKYPVAHRYSGRLAILSSFSLGISGMLFSPYKLAFTAPAFHLHRFRVGFDDEKYTILFWPSFDFGIWVIGPALLIPAFFTIKTARAKKFQDHRYWANLLTIFGYVVPLQRVFMILLNMVGFAIIPYLTPAQKSFFGCPDDLSISAKSAAEKAGFAWTTWAAAIVMITYTIKMKDGIKS